MSTEGSFHSVTKKLLQLNHFSQQCPSFRLQCEHCSRSETLCDSKITHRRFGEALVQFCGLAVFSCLTRHVTRMVCVKSDNCIIKLFQPFHNSVTNCTNIFIERWLAFTLAWVVGPPSVCDGTGCLGTLQDLQDKICLNETRDIPVLRLPT